MKSTPNEITMLDKEKLCPKSSLVIVKRLIESHDSFEELTFQQFVEFVNLSMDNAVNRFMIDRHSGVSLTAVPIAKTHYDDKDRSTRTVSLQQLYTENPITSRPTIMFTHKLKPKSTITVMPPKNSSWGFTKIHLRIYQLVNGDVLSKATFSFDLKGITNLVENYLIRSAFHSISDWIADFGKIEPQMFDFFGTSTITDDIGDLVGYLRNKLPAMENTGSQLSNLVSQIEKLISQNTELPKSCEEAMKKVSSISAQGVTMESLKIMSIVFFCAATAHLIVSGSDESNKIFLMSIFCVVLFARDLVISLLCQAFSMLKSFGETTFQAGVDLGTSIAVMIMTTLLGSKIKQQDARTIISSVASFDRFRDGIVSLFTWVSQLIVSLVNFSGFGDYIPHSMKYMFLNNNEVRDYIDSVQKVIDEINAKAFVFSDENFNTINFLIEKGKKIRLNVRDSASISALTSELNMLITLSVKMRESNFNLDGRRQEPIVLVLMGPPGQLKSQMMAHFITAIAHKVYSPSFLQDFDKTTGRYVYTSAQENGFWDGYDYNKKFVTFDDFGQCTDVAGNPDNEYMKLIRAVGEEPYILHMAELEKKGATFFSSDFIIITSNRTDFSTVQSIIDPGALYRRMHIPIYTTIKREFAEDSTNPSDWDKADGSKFPVDDNGTYFEPSMVNFADFDLYSGKRTGTLYAFDEIVDRVVQGYHEHKRRFDQKTTQLLKTADRVDRCIPMDSLDDILGLDGCSNSSSDDEQDFSFVYDVDSALRERYRLLYEYMSKEGRLKELDDFGMVVNNCFRTRLPTKSVILYSIKNFPMELAEYLRDGTVTQHLISVILASDFGSFCEVSGKIVARQPLKSRFVDVYLDKDGILKKVFGDIWGHLVAYKYLYSTILVFAVPLFGYFQQKKDKLYYLSCGDEDCPLYYNSTEEDGEDYYKLWCISDGGTSHNCVDDPDSFKVDIDRLKFMKKIPDLVSKSFLTKRLTEYQSGYVMKARREARRKVRFQAGGTQDDNGRSSIDTILKTNVYKLLYTNDIREDINSESKWEVLGMITFIADTIALMPKHFIAMMKKAIDSDLCSATANSCVKLMRHTDEGPRAGAYLKLGDFLNPSKILETEDMRSRDSVCVILPRSSVRVHRNIVKKFPYLHHLSQIGSSFSYRLVGLPSDHISDFSGVSHIVGDQVISGEDLTDYLLVRPYSYSANTNRGDCGSLFCIENPRLIPKIFGMHVAGTKSPIRYGFAAPVMREDLEKIVDMASEIYKPIISDDVEFQCAPIPCNSIPSGLPQLFDIPKSVGVTRGTHIIPSPLNNMWPMKPMGTTDLSLDAYEKAIKLYDKDDILLRKSILTYSCNAVFGDLQSRSFREVTKRLYTYNEAFFGLQDDPDYGPISRTTSPGYPFTAMKGTGSGKQKWLGKEPTPSLTEEGYELVGMAEEVEDKCAEGIRPLTIYTDNLKDEKVSLRKVHLSKTRLFSGVPLLHLIMVRRYFGAFSNWIFKNRIKNGIAVGTNPYSEWHLIAEELLQHSHPCENGFLAADFSGFDTSGKRVIYNMILVHINKWYDDGHRNQTIRKVLWLDLVQSRHVHRNHVFEWYNSLPSGHPLTVIVNSLYNLIAFRYCWVRSHDNEISSCVSFSKYVYLIVYGDDANASVDKRKRKIFNDLTIQVFMKELDLTYTSDTKKAFEGMCRSLADITFLKRYYLKDETSGMYTAPLTLEVILTTPGWTRETDIFGITKNNVDWALRELALWPEEVYDEWMPKIVTQCSEHLDWIPSVTSYEINRVLILNEDAFY